jgi:hypothetical protein
MAQEQEKESRPAWLIWLYLAPVYVLLAYPLARWIRGMANPDVQLSTQQKDAFSTSQKMADTDVAISTAAPQLQSDSISLYNKGSSVMPVYDTSKSGDAATPQATAVAQSVQNGGDNGTKSEQVKWTATGATRGLLTEAIGKLLGKPGLVKAMLDNSLVINAFMNRSTVQGLVNNPKALMNFATSDGRVATFLNNPVVQAAMKNPAIINAVASSGMMEQLLQTPAVQTLASDPSSVNQILKQNPLLASAVNNPNVAAALQQNPATSSLYTALQMVQQTNGGTSANGQTTVPGKLKPASFSSGFGN